MVVDVGFLMDFCQFKQPVTSDSFVLSLTSQHQLYVEVFTPTSFALSVKL